MPIGQDDSSFENGEFRRCLLFGKTDKISEDERCLRIYGGKPGQNNNNHIKLAKIYNNMATVSMRLSLSKAVL